MNSTSIFNGTSTTPAKLHDVINTVTTAETPAPCDQTLEMIFWLLNGTLGFVVLIGNGTILVVIVTNQRLRHQIMNIFSGSLAVADVGMGVVVVPGYGMFCNGCNDYAQSAYCWLFQGGHDVFIASSIFNLMAITYDRFIAVKQPLHYNTMMTRERVTGILVVVWGIPLTIAACRNFWQHTHTVEEIYTIEKIYHNTLLFCFVFIPIFIILVANIIIISAIKRQSQQIHPNEDQSSRAESIRRKKGTISCVMVVLIFIIAWIPRAFYSLSSLVFDRPGLVSPVLIKLSLLFLIIQSSVNPIIYSFFRRDFRQAAIRLFTCYSRG